MKQLTTLAALLLACVFLSSAAQAQTRGKISGRISDAATGETLPGVSVAVVGTSLGAITDISGDYFIANLDPGTYTVRATYIGYRDIVMEGIEVNANRTTDIDFALESATVEIDQDIVVEASRPLVEADNTTSSVRLESEEVTSLPTSELTDVLVTLPGVNVENGEVLFRGGTLDQVAFIIDGTRLRDPVTSAPYTRLPLSAIQEAEVITGAFSAEYGEAQSGVINVITKEGSQDRYELYLDSRYQPAGVRHWGPSFYDTSTPEYWENTHARHLDWWVEYPDQWTDPSGVPGSDPRSTWTPEQAYENFVSTHQPLSNYNEIPSYQLETGFGGPVPFVNGLTFYTTLKRLSQAPLYGNAFRERGEFTDGTAKMAYRFGRGMKLSAFAFTGQDESGWGFENDPFWAEVYANRSRYAYYNQANHNTSRSNGQSIQFAHALNASTFYELRVGRIQAKLNSSPFPGDSLTFAQVEGPTAHNYFDVKDANGDEISWLQEWPLGYHMGPYLFRYDVDNVEWKLNGAVGSQLNKFLYLKTGFEHSQYDLSHLNVFKPNMIDSASYNPIQGALYTQSKIELGGLIINAGLRWDYYNLQDTLYANVFDPFFGPKEKTRTITQLSPRIGVSHPIDSKTKLHFSYGHFLQRPDFNNYGELFADQGTSLTTVRAGGARLPFVLGNRNLQPMKTIGFEVGLERNFWDFFVADVVAYYKDIRSTVRSTTIRTASGGTYRLNTNGDYADEQGFELSLRKVPSVYSWGAIWGHVNYSARTGIVGRSGAPAVIVENGKPVYAASGDFVVATNPFFKAGLFYRTPDNGGALGAVLGDISFALDYQANLPNERLLGDILTVQHPVEGFPDSLVSQTHTRPIYSVFDFRARKDIKLFNNRVSLSPYVEVQNALNQVWANISAIQSMPNSQRLQYVDSGFKDLPDYTGSDENRIPILESALALNLPRSIIFGLKLEF